jgi:hypothetical protein
MEFHHEGHNYVQAISPFEFARCFHLDNDITYKLSHPSNIFCLDAAIPGRTLAHIFDQVLSHLVCIRNANCSIFSPSQYAAPAACAQAFLNSAVGIKLPDKDQWVEAYSYDPIMHSILGFVKCPGTISNKALEASGIDYNYRAALWHSCIIVEDKILIYYKPIAGSLSYARLQLVPANFFKSSSLHSIPILLASTSIPTTLFITCAFDSTGPACSNTSNACAAPAPAERLQTHHTPNLPNWSITSRLKLQ